MNDNKVVYKDIQDIDMGIKFDTDKNLISFIDAGWGVTDINVIKKEIVCRSKDAVATFCFNDENNTASLIFRSTIDGNESTYVSLTLKEMAIFTSLLTFDFSTLAKLFIKINEV